MGKMQRNKGAAYEREICKKLAEATGREVKRNIGQARDGGTDIPFGNFRIEAKRRRTLGTIEKWLKQSKDACPKDELPAVVARSDGGESMVILSLDTFLLLVRLANV